VDNQEIQVKDVVIGDKLWFINFIEHDREFDEVNGGVVDDIIYDGSWDMYAIHYQEPSGRRGWIICDEGDVLEKIVDA